VTKTVSLPVAESRPISVTDEDGWKKLFGAWQHAGNEDQQLEEIYRSRLVPSTAPDDE
jgi:hypothetical protein